MSGAQTTDFKDRERPATLCWNLQMVVTPWFRDEHECLTRYVYRADDEVWKLPIDRPGE
jgi:hypothetical protein